MMEPTVSILITAYQAENDIARALGSLRRQTMADWEAVVVDDGSTDRTLALVQELAGRDTRVRPFGLPTNRGPAAARNAGLALCRGEWVAMLDSDDAFAPQRLAHLLEGAGTADMVSDNLRLVEYPSLRLLGEAVLPEALPPTGWIDALGYALSNDFTAGRYGWGYLKPMVRCNLLRRHGLRFAEDLRVCEDYHFHLDCLLVGARWRMIEGADYLYSIRPGSLSQTLSVETLGAILRHSVRLLEDPRLGEAIRAALLTRHRNIERLLAYLGVREALRRRRLGAALRGVAAKPDLVGWVAAAVWRRRRKARQDPDRAKSTAAE